MPERTQSRIQISSQILSTNKLMLIIVSHSDGLRMNLESGHNSESKQKVGDFPYILHFPSLHEFEII